MRHILVLLLVFLAFSGTKSGELSAHVEKTYYLKGKVREREIAIKMLCYDEMPTRHINYFFQDDKMDRYLVGKLIDNTWSFIPEPEKERDDFGPGVKLKIADGKNGMWKGTWTDSSGKTVDLVLNPIPPDSVFSEFGYLSFVQELDPYERYRLSNMDLIKIRTEKLTKDLVSDWYLEKRSGISFFRVRSNNHTLTTDSMNVTLTTIHLSLIQKYFGYHPDKIVTKFETSLHYLTNELISFEVTATSTFKTYKPSKRREIFTFDIKSGMKANLEDLIWFDPAASKPPVDDLFKIYKYRKNIFATRIFGLLQELYPDKMKTDSCNINKPAAWALPSWSLTTQGIAFSLNTSDACHALSWAIIPYEQLKPFMEKRYQLMHRR